MPWTRIGDNAATYPPLMQVAGFTGATSSTVNEVFGFVLRCATQSAGHLTDYVIDVGTAHMIGGPRTTKLLGWCVAAGLLTPIEVEGIRKWVILNDPDFIHIRTAAEIEWERQRKADNRDPALMVHVRRRDGDNCRYCGVLVHWTGPKSNRSAQPDHREPGKPGTVETMVVACVRCNSSRQDSAIWDADHPLRPEPTHPNYGKATATYLTTNGYPTEPNIAPDTHLTSSADTAAPPRPAAPTRPTSSADTAAVQRPAAPQPGTSSADTAATPRPAAPQQDDDPTPEPVDTAAEGATHGPGDGPESTPESGPESGPSSGLDSAISPPEFGFVGSGRDGTGREPPEPARRRRGSRGRARSRERPPPARTPTSTTADQHPTAHTSTEEPHP